MKKKPITNKCDYSPCIITDIENKPVFKFDSIHDAYIYIKEHVKECSYMRILASVKIRGFYKFDNLLLTTSLKLF